MQLFSSIQWQKDAWEHWKKRALQIFALISVSLEMIKTLRRVVAGKAPLMNNSTMPRVVVASVAKQPLKAGQVLEQALGGYQVRGEAVMAAEVPDAVPLGLLDGARILRAVEKDQTLNWADVETREGLALNAALALRDRMAAGVPVLDSLDLP